MGMARLDPRPIGSASELYRWELILMMVAWPYLPSWILLARQA